jgi:hypothetical protein
MNCNKEVIPQNSVNSGYLIVIVLYILLAIILSGSYRSF